MCWEVLQGCDVEFSLLHRGIGSGASFVEKVASTMPQVGGTLATGFPCSFPARACSLCRWLLRRAVLGPCSCWSAGPQKQSVYLGIPPVYGPCFSLVCALLSLSSQRDESSLHRLLPPRPHQMSLRPQRACCMRWQTGNVTGLGSACGLRAHGEAVQCGLVACNHSLRFVQCRYEGQWVDNEMHGTGIYMSPKLSDHRFR